MNVFELFGTIAINNRDANSALKDTAQKADRTGKQIQEAFKKVGSATLKVSKAVVSGAVAVASAWAATIETTRDYRTAMAKLDTVYISNGHSAETAMKTYKALQAVLGDTDQAVEAASHLAVMCDNEEDLAKWTDICMGVYATFGDSLPIEGLTEAANETAKTGVVTGSLADALNWAGISEEDFNLKLRACRTEQERQSLIMNTLFGQYKSSAEQYKVTGESVMKANAAQENLNSALAKLGEIGEPIMTGLKNWVADMVNAAAPHIQTLIDKLANFDTTMETEVWPWLQKEVKMKLGVDLPDWDTFKVNVQTWWTDTAKPFAESFCRFNLAFMGILPWNEENQKFLIDWWDGVYATIGEICTWKLPSPTELTEEDAQAVINSIQVWWNGVVSRLKLMIGITPQVQAKYNAYQGGISGASGGSAASGMIMNNFTTNSDAWGIQSAVQALFNWNSSNAVGLDRVPRDGYLIRAHKDETLLNKAEADAYHSGGKVEALLSQVVTLLSQQKSVVLDSGALVGQLAPAMDTRLGTIGNRKGRGN